MGRGIRRGGRAGAGDRRDGRTAADRVDHPTGLTMHLHRGYRTWVAYMLQGRGEVPPHWG